MSSTCMLHHIRGGCPILPRFRYLSCRPAWRNECEHDTSNGLRDVEFASCRHANWPDLAVVARILFIWTQLVAGAILNHAYFRVGGLISTLVLLVVGCDELSPWHCALSDPFQWLTRSRIPSWPCVAMSRSRLAHRIHGSMTASIDVVLMWGFVIVPLCPSELTHGRVPLGLLRCYEGVALCTFPEHATRLLPRHSLDMWAENMRTKARHLRGRLSHTFRRLGRASSIDFHFDAPVLCLFLHHTRNRGFLSGVLLLWGGRVGIRRGEGTVEDSHDALAASRCMLCNRSTDVAHTLCCAPILLETRWSARCGTLPPR